MGPYVLLSHRLHPFLPAGAMVSRPCSARRWTKFSLKDGAHKMVLHHQETLLHHQETLLSFTLEVCKGCLSLWLSACTTFPNTEAAANDRHASYFPLPPRVLFHYLSLQICLQKTSVCIKPQLFSVQGWLNQGQSPPL